MFPKFNAIYEQHFIPAPVVDRHGFPLQIGSSVRLLSDPQLGLLILQDVTDKHIILTKAVSDPRTGSYKKIKLGKSAAKDLVKATSN